MDKSVGDLYGPIGLGRNYLKSRNCSTMTAECHVRYLREVRLGDPVQVSMLIIAADDKRIHFFEELRHATEGWLSAASETSASDIRYDCAQGCAVPVRHRRGADRAVAEAHARVPRPDAVGRIVALPTRATA